VVDAKSGVSGAGAKATETVHYAHTEGSVRPYRVGNHQHVPEIELVLERAATVSPTVTFVPHLVPAVRGVLVTCYAPLAGHHGVADLAGVLTAAYERAPFVRVLAPGEMPDPKRVTGANVCEIGVGLDPRSRTVIAVGAVDNLVKGAAGQAIQNFNLMFGFEETTALPSVGLYP
jgi:N-acetyl-gamma-glutamyl-phosphate reductase